VRDLLVAALTACAETTLQARVRRFLAGLSCDELEFIAGFFGGCILATNAGSNAPPGNASQPCADSGLPAADLDHKLILVHEYLAYSRPLSLSTLVSAARH
jgi:hypothetical protein